MMSTADWVWYFATLVVFLPVALWTIRRRAMVRRRRWIARHSYVAEIRIHEETK